MGIAYNTSIVRNGLVMHLDASNIKSYASGTAWSDIGGSSIPATLQNSGAATVTGVSGSAGYLNFAAVDAAGTAGYYLINSSAISSLTTLSLETCLYVNTFYTSSGATHARPISPRITESGSPLGVGIFNGSLSIEINAGGTWFTTSYSNASIGSGKWLYISQVTDNVGKTLKTYLNGVLINTLPFTGTPSSGGGILLGRGFYGGTLNYAGRIGFVRVYNTALSANEVQQNFEATRGRYGI
jgi:hypothetical protein